MAGGHPVRGPGSLQGRGSECALLDDVIAALRAGECRTLLLHGEAGIGKTALLNYAVASAADMRVLHAAGVESGMEVPSAGSALTPPWPPVDRLLTSRGCLAKWQASPGTRPILRGCRRSYRRCGR